MTFPESISACFSKYATFTGIAVRSEFWWFALFTFLASGILEIVSAPLSGIFSLATIVPSLAVGCRRLHDTDRSGWCQLLWFIPVIGWIVLIVFLAQESRPNRFGTSYEVPV